jgi:1-deoxy-D-xylulose-5-phosphate reductoisomerase
MKKKVAILGATGSIGSSTLDVVEQDRDLFDVVLLSAHRDSEALERIGLGHPKAVLALSSEGAADSAIRYRGEAGLLRAIEDAGADIVVNGIAGSAGLKPSITAARTGCLLALANKETIVMAAPIVFALAEAHSSTIIPMDSEHSAIFHLLHAHGHASVEELLLTASGGPFRGFTPAQLEKVTVQDALAHPTWKMGGKITIDSASLANKGLEVIEAVRLFNVPPERVTVVVHPQSLVHSMIRVTDGSVYAQMSRPDMRLPIHNALHWPHTLPCSFGRLTFDSLLLTFDKPDTKAFPMLPLAYEAARRSACYPTAYLAADEVAVDAFLKGDITFLQIADITHRVLEDDWSMDGENLESVLSADQRARERAQAIIREIHS